MLPISGKLAERFGRRRVFMASLLAFTLASFGCGMADNIYVLIVLRTLQAAGGAGFTPTATGIIVDHFGSARDRYVSLFGSIFPVGAMALVPLYAINRYSIGVVGAGTLLTAQGAAAMICSLAAVVALRRTDYRLPLYVGSAVTIVGLVLLALPPMAGISPYTWLAFAAFLVGAGNGTINPAMRNAGLQLAPESSSMLAALRTLALQIGSIVTISVVAAVLAHQSNMGEVLAWVYVILAAIRLLALPLVRYVPEQRGAW